MSVCRQPECFITNWHTHNVGTNGIIGQVCKHGQLARSCEICDLYSELREIQADRDKLSTDLLRAEQEIVRLSGKTGYCLQCEAYAKKAERYKKGLEDILKHCEVVLPKGSHLMGTYQIAQKALSEGEEGKP